MKKSNIKKNLFKTFCLCVVTGAFFNPSNISAQTTWIEEEQGNSISLEVYRPAVPRDSFFNEILPAYTTFTGSIFLSGRYNIYRNLTLVADLPFAGGNYDDKAYTGLGQFLMGNPYIGAEYRLPQSPVFFELGFRIPLVPEDNVTARLAGVYSDFDRGEAFAHKIVPVFAAVNYETVSESNILLRGRTGVNIWFNSKAAGLEAQPYISVDYSLQSGYLHRYIHVIAGFSGRFFNDTGPRYPEKGTELQYGLTLTLPFERIRPGFVMKIPGNAFTGNFINYVLGLNLTYSFDKF